MRKTFLATLALIAVGACFAFTVQDDHYKNLKILPKDITEKQLDSVMHHFNVSLGVRCNFCHVRDTVNNKMDFASDGNKHKLVAREMMTMTYKINEKYFDLAGGKKDLNTQLMVTCYTCHHGKTEPETKGVEAPRPDRKP